MKLIRFTLVTLCGLLLGARLLAPVWADEQPSAEARRVEATIMTASDEQIRGPLAALREGVLSVALDPPREVPLDEVQRVEFGQAAAVAPAGSGASDLEWLGQDKHDLVQVGGATGGNGVQDLHLRVKQLKPLALKQVLIVCRLPKQLRAWRLDPAQSPHWRLALQRAEKSAVADLFLEPPADDCFGQKFDATFTYEDGSTSKLSVTASTHTSDQTKMGSATTTAGPAEAAGTKTPSGSLVYLADGNLLSGEIVRLNSETLVVRTAWHDGLEVPLLRVKGIWFNVSGPGTARGEFDQQMAAPQGDDVVFVTAADKSTATVQGRVQSLGDARLTIHFEGADRGIRQDRLLGLVFAAHPAIPPLAGLHAQFRFVSGDTLAARWVGWANDQLELETAWKSRISVAASKVSDLRTRGGKLTLLTELDPASVEEVPYFGRIVSWRRNAGFDGAPPKLKGKQPTNSIAMHSQCVLTYTLDGQYDKFKATVGFDDSAGSQGRVGCRVLVDGREAFAERDLRSNADPRELDISLTGAKQLTLEVGFGEDQDVGDRVLWTEPRLFRAP